MGTLERTLRLRSFNRAYCAMGKNNESPMAEFCGWVDYPATYPRRPSEEIREAMKYFPVFQTYGLNYNDCMKLPRNEWTTLLRDIKKLPVRQEPDALTQIHQLLMGMMTAFVPKTPDPSSGTKT